MFQILYYYKTPKDIQSTLTDIKELGFHQSHLHFVYLLYFIKKIIYLNRYIQKIINYIFPLPIFIDN
jgi:hypothetical protein